MNKCLNLPQSPDVEIINLVILSEPKLFGKILYFYFHTEFNKTEKKNFKIIWSFFKLSFQKLFRIYFNIIHSLL